ncbi:peptidase inhibitor family I36 protein [Streptomyces sp. NPDC093516]|uniref:peptidase inhibitor family I36 protein n=1 Tax=Streptomyces sp. NPDC093516 TaxID=3155304 RepID=UPI00343D962A
MIKVSRALTAIVLASTFSIGGASAASAGQQTPAGADSWSQCESGDWCMWDYDNAGGDVYFDLNAVKYNPNLADPGYGWNDRANSVANMSSKYVCVFWDKDLGGSYVRVAPNSRVNLPVTWKNRVSSYRSLPAGISSCVFD